MMLERKHKDKKEYKHKAGTKMTKNTGTDTGARTMELKQRATVEHIQKQ